MRVLNKFNLPQPFVDLVSQDHYDPGASDISTTSLISPPKVRTLFSRHADEIEEDASDRVWTMSGTAKHWMLEQIAKSNPARYIAEERMYLVVDGVKVGGQIDLYDRETETLHDWKEVGVWKVMGGDLGDFAAQGNINKVLCEANGIFPKKLSNIAIIKDWKKREAKIKEGYPPCPVKEIPLPIWQSEETMAFIKSRIRLHYAAKEMADDDIPECTKKERWEGDTVYAVMKSNDAKMSVKGGKYEDKEEAYAHARKIGGIVQERGGKPTRCIDWCAVKQWCHHGRTITE